jgi:hypothetical protein
MFKCAKSATGQVIQGLKHLSQQISGEGEYSNDKKETFNNYQKELYPNMARIALKVVNAYNEKFIADITDPLMKQVFGANLNGNKNNGQLNKFIPCKGVNRFLSYKFAQFGQLLTLLGYRLMFIANRDPEYVKRYKENELELKHFKVLRVRASEFCTYLKDEIFTEWAKCVSDARNVQNDTLAPVKLTADNVVRREMDARRANFFGEYDNGANAESARYASYNRYSSRPQSSISMGFNRYQQKYNYRGNFREDTQKDYSNEMPTRRIISGPCTNVQFGYEN